MGVSILEGSEERGRRGEAERQGMRILMVERSAGTRRKRRSAPSGIDPSSIEDVGSDAQGPCRPDGCAVWEYEVMASLLKTSAAVNDDLLLVAGFDTMEPHQACGTCMVPKPDKALNVGTPGGHQVTDRYASLVC